MLAGPRHPLAEAGFASDSGRWRATGDVTLWWDRERMDWVLAVQIDVGCQVRTRFDWRDLRLNVEE